MKSRIGYALITLICATAVMASGGAHAQNAEDALRISEVSIQDTLKRALDENQKLKEEKDRLQSQVSQFESRIAVYVERLRSLNLRINDLQREVENKVRECESAKNRLTENIEEAKEEKKQIEDECALLAHEIKTNDYFRLWQEAEHDLQIAEERLTKVSRERARYYERNGKLHYNLGNLYFKNGEYKKAAREYEQALEFLPGDADVYYNLAVLYDYHLKDSEKAVRYYQWYLEKEPESSNASLAKERLADAQFRKKMDN